MTKPRTRRPLSDYRPAIVTATAMGVVYSAAGGAFLVRGEPGLEPLGCAILGALMFLVGASVLVATFFAGPSLEIMTSPAESDEYDNVDAYATHIKEPSQAL